MYAPDDSTTFINGPFGCLIRRFRPAYSYVYLLHFSRPYHHAQHYLGSTCDLEHRLQLHRNGNGARLMEVIALAGIGFEVCRLWRTDTYEEARTLERKLKKQHNGLRLCPICQHRPVDNLVLLRQGHFPFHLFKPGRQRPLVQQPPHFVTREKTGEGREASTDRTKVRNHMNAELKQYQIKPEPF